MSGSRRLAHTSSVLSYSTIAPVGQCAEHWPQRTHGDSASVMSPAGAMRVSMPRCRKLSAHTSWICWQTWMHRPQLMHFRGSSTIACVVSSSGRSGTMLSRVTFRRPKSAAMVWSSQFWLRPHVRHSLGCLDMIISMTVRRTWISSGSSVTMFMPGSSGVQQARSIFLEPATRTMQMPHAAVASRSGCLHRVGMWTDT